MAKTAPMKHYIRVTSGPYSGAIYALPTKKDALVLERALQKLRPNSTDYGNDRDGFPEVHLKGRRASTSPRHHSTKKQPNGNKAWYVFYIPKGRMPKSFGGRSGQDWPKAYFGPYESRAAATSAVQGEMAVFEEPATRYKIRNVTPQEFAKLWGNPPESDFADPWSVALKKRGHA